jgi:hypothetical protein
MVITKQCEQWQFGDGTVQGLGVLLEQITARSSTPVCIA